jgi:hypothetical protein
MAGVARLPRNMEPIVTDHVPAQWRDRGQIIAGLIAERDNLRREVEQLRNHCGPACPFRACKSCTFQGGA